MAYNIIAWSMKLGRKASRDDIAQISKYAFLDFSVAVVVTVFVQETNLKSSLTKIKPAATIAHYEDHVVIYLTPLALTYPLL